MEEMGYGDMLREIPIEKITIIGDSGVGKTNIILQYCSGEFVEDKDATIAVQFFRKKIEVGELAHWLHIWDTGGQERFQSITSIYYRGSKGVLIVFDLTNMDSFRAVRRWFDRVMEKLGVDIPPSPTSPVVTTVPHASSSSSSPRIRMLEVPEEEEGEVIPRGGLGPTIGRLKLPGAGGRFSDAEEVVEEEVVHIIDASGRKPTPPTAEPKAAFILIGNKADLVEDRVVPKEQILDLAEDLGGIPYIECSAKTGQNVPLCFQTLVNEIFENRRVWKAQRRAAGQDAIDSPADDSLTDETVQLEVNMAKKAERATCCFGS